MSFQSTLARIGGDIWRSWQIVSIWPWPAICIGYPHSKFNWTDYRFFRSVLKPGDMLLMKADKYVLSNRGIAGTAFKHLAVYTGAVKGLRGEENYIEYPKSLGVEYAGSGHSPSVFGNTVTHAISDGVVCQDLGDVLFHEDYVLIVRPFVNATQQEAVVNAALSQVGKGYNFDFTPWGPPGLYCTELGEYCCAKAQIVPPPRVNRNVNWKGLLVPRERYKAYVAVADQFALHFPVVGISKLCDNQALLGSSEWSEELRRRIVSAPNAYVG